MLDGVTFVLATTLAASVLETQTTNLILLGAVIVGGIFAWRQKRGDFYKSVAEEKKAEAVTLRSENEKLRNATDIRPVLDRLEQLATALDVVVSMSGQVVAKVEEMNGSLKAHEIAMRSLSDRIVLDEAARGLLQAAAERGTPRAKTVE